jgi:hypothetical protein
MRTTWLTLLLAGLLGCGSSVTTLGGADAATASDAGAAVTDRGAAVTDAGTAGPCAPGDLCLQPRTPVAGISLTAGRLGVVWAQLNDDGPDPAPQVAYDVAFGGGAAQVNVPLAALAAPGDAVLYCARACNDEAMCPCTGGPRIAIAYAVVAVDANANGRIDLGGENGVGRDPLVATGYVVVASSPDAMAVASAPLDMLFTNGIARGVAPYPLVPRGTNRHSLAAPGFGRVYDLNFCPPEVSACARYTPDLD